MSIRHLDSFLAPRSVAVFGATERPGAIGSVITRNIVEGGFAGSVTGVNPHYTRVHGIPCFPDAEALPEAPELAIIASPFESAAGIVAALGRRGTRAVVLISAPGGEAAANARARGALLECACAHDVRIVGPNCLGVMAPHAALNATFAPLGARPGRLAFVAQSGALATSMVDWAHARDIGFSAIFSLGDMVDVDFGDMLDFLAADPHTDAILLYIESVTNARKFVSAARAAARSKPVIAVKGGRFASGARAAATHTGALVGSDAVYEAVFRRTGIVRVDTLEELFDAAGTLSRLQRLPGERLAIVTNGGGMAVLAADALAARNGTLATLSPATLAALEAFLPRNWSRANPVDVIGDADPERLARAAATVAADPGVDALLVAHCPTAVCPSRDAAESLVAAMTEGTTATLLTSWVGGSASERARERFDEAGIPAYATPEQAIRAFMYAVEHRRGQAALTETPASAPEPRREGLAAARAIVDRALAAGREWLDPADVRAVLAQAGFTVLATTRVDDAAGAGEAAARIGAPVALKIRSPDVPHKTDVGGVVLDLQGAEATREAALAMAAGIRRRLPEARIEGFDVEPMADRRRGFELLLGMSPDAQFGPVLVFGHGGTAVEAIDDRAIALPPLNRMLAGEVIGRTRISRLLHGARGLPTADFGALELALVQLSELVCELPAIAELDINPLLLGAEGAVVLDARVRIAPPATHGPRLAIRPYPSELEEDVRLSDGRRLWLRPVRPEDETAMARAFGSLTPEEVYLRFFAPLKSLSHRMGAGFTQIDYERQMAFILTGHGPPGTTDYLGSVNVVCDADMQSAEFAILVHHSLAGQGLGRLLMERMIAWARSRGIREIAGDVLARNTAMVSLCRDLGFRVKSNAQDATVLRVVLPLEP